MNLVFVVQEKNIKDVVVPYNKKIIDTKTINPNIDAAVTILLDFKI